jgi:hypothetical protein
VVLVSAGVLSVVWALTRANQVGWTSAETVAMLVVGGVLLGGFVLWEGRAPAPMLPLRLLRIPAFSAGSSQRF